MCKLLETKIEVDNESVLEEKQRSSVNVRAWNVLQSEGYDCILSHCGGNVEAIKRRRLKWIMSVLHETQRL